MFRYKLLKVGIATVSVISFLISPLADYLKAKTLRRYDLRWYQSTDQANLLQKIVVRNAGTEPKENLVLELSFNTNASRVLADFDVSSDKYGPAENFLDTVARTSIGEPVGLLTAAETTRVSQLLDRHFSHRSLNYLDGAFDEILNARMEQANEAPALTILKNNQIATANWHSDWSQRCSTNHSNDCRSVDTVLGDWEKARSNFRNAVLQNWKERTGITLSSSSDHLSLDNKLLLTFSLGPKEQRILNFHYEKNPGSVLAAFRGTKGETTYQLDEEESLTSSFFALLLGFYPLLYLLLFFVPLCIYLFGWLLLPLQIVPTYHIFNFAMESKDEDHWKQAFERHRYFILRQFRVLKKKESSQAEMTEQEVLDLVRDWLIERHRSGSPRFKSAKSLDRSIHHELWRLALQT